MGLYCVCGCMFYFSAIFVLITYIGGQDRLHCSHEALHLAIQEPTVFTQITGTYYVISYFYSYYIRVATYIKLYIK